MNDFRICLLLAWIGFEIKHKRYCLLLELQPSDGKYLIVFTFRDKKLEANKYPSFDGPQLSDGWQGPINADAD